MIDIFSNECQYNILGHLKECWKHIPPTGAALEKAIYEGILPFYNDVKLLASPSTIIDVGKDSDGLDIKGLGSLKHSVRINKNTDAHEQILPNGSKIYVKVPSSIVTQVRRPNVDLENYTGDPRKILREQMKDYYRFALTTKRKDGYKDLYSIVSLYGIDEGFKSVFLTVEKFSYPKVSNYVIGTNKDKEPNSYKALNENKEVLFTLSSFNKGSSNFYKQFVTNSGILMTWPEEERDCKIYTKEELEETCAIKRI